MAPKTLPPPDIVRQLLDYDPATGILIWKPRPREMFATNRAFGAWNARYAGKPAGTPTRGHLGIQLKCIGRGSYLAHRLVWLLERGEPVPIGIDHADLDQTNNRLENLRAATQSQNLANARLRSDNSSGFKGVVRVEQRYVAQIHHMGVTTNLGRFDSAEEAAAAYREAAIRLFKQFARWE